MLLTLIYLSFISLGLPDSILGAGWPSIHDTLKIPVSYIGILTMTVTFFTVLSTILADKFIQYIDAGKITVISVFLTAFAMISYFFADSFIMLLLLSIPLGFGAGAIDATLNNYVSLHYSSRHMNFLHSFWGVGVTISPYIMGYFLSLGYGWNFPYLLIGIVQMILFLCLLFGMPLWKKDTIAKHKQKSVGKLKKKTVAISLLAFLCYSTVEVTTGTWAATFFVETHGLSTDMAAKFSSIFFLSITIGRIASGIVADKLGDRRLIIFGCITLIFGVLLTFFSLNLALIGLFIAGFGCAPIFPSVIHSVPRMFGREHSQKVISLHMSTAYLGSMLMSPLFGLMAQGIGLFLLPFYLIVFSLIMTAIFLKHS